MPIKGETITTVMEYVAKTNPTQKPGMAFSSKTDGRKRLARAYTLFVHTMTVNRINYVASQQLIMLL